MNRRTLILGAAALGVTSPVWGAQDYTPGLVAEALADGQTVFLDFKAAWCSTCRVQERHITALRSENPAYDAALTFINVDWDRYRSSDLTRRLNVPRRSTLVALRGDMEIGRVVAGTSRARIKELMDQALAAAG